MLTAYFDESYGTPKGGEPATEQFLVAGYVSDDRNWKRFERKWTGALIDTRLPYIHWKDLLTGTGVYAKQLGGSGQLAIDKRARVARRFVSIIADPTLDLQGIVTSFKSTDFSGFLPIIEQMDQVARYIFKPHHFASKRCSLECSHS